MLPGRVLVKGQQVSITARVSFSGQPVPSGGQLLREGDIVILAAVRPQAPSLDTPGVAGLRFRALCA